MRVDAMAIFNYANYNSSHVEYTFIGGDGFVNDGNHALASLALGTAGAAIGGGIVDPIVEHLEVQLVWRLVRLTSLTI